MSEDFEKETRTAQEGELQEVLLREQEKNTQLKEYLSHLLKENSDYKKQYNELQQRVSGLTNLFEKNARIFQELYDDTKSALQMGTFTTINNSLPQPPESRTLNLRETVLKITPQPGPSGVAKPRSKVNIGRLDLKELEKSLETVEREPTSNLVNGTKSPETNEHLTTILEENTRVTSTEGALAKAKDVRVWLSRLPYEIVQEHLHKYESVDSSVDLSVMDPHFTSTPLKLETMKGLGLLPSGAQSRFVNTRRIYKKEKVHSSPTKRCNELRNLAIDTNEGLEIQRNGILSTRRPTRKTKPQQLKEPSLKRKVRRS